MMKGLAALLIAAMVLPVGTAQGDESTFLRSLEGNWSGTGTVTVRADSLPMKVSCRFKSDTTARSLSWMADALASQFFRGLLRLTSKPEGRITAAHMSAPGAARRA
jgi:hypothetical protein